MALTAGLVQSMMWTAGIVCVGVGSSPSSVEAFFVRFSGSDTAAELAFKRNLVTVLVSAQIASYPVEVVHPDGGGEITGAGFGRLDICPVGPAIHNDFYGITGSGIPAGAQLVFETLSTTVTVTPDLVRPQWVFVAALPTAVPIGRNFVRLEVGGWVSNSVPVDVSAGPATVIRALYSGAPKSQPYTIALVANAGIETEAGSLVGDPLLTNRAGFHDAVGFCLRSLLTASEDVVRQGEWDREIRFVAIFDATLPSDDANSLVHELTPNVMETRRDRLTTFLSRYGERADIVLVIHASTTHDRASAWFTTDAAQPGTPYSYDGIAHVHGHFASTPGSAALSVNMNRRGLTPLHECGHAISDFNNGRIVDLYVDGTPGAFVVNKKFRAQSADAVPPLLASYDGTNFPSDQQRDGLGYPAGWKSYHPAPIDATRPNVMDNYWLAFDDPQRCRLDLLIHPWVRDRLRAKLMR